LHFRLYKEDEDPIEEDDEHLPIDPEATSPDLDDIEHDSFDELLLTEPIIFREGQQTRVKIIGRKRNQNGELIGRYNANLILNTRIYLAEFPDGHVQELSANAVIEAINNQIDEEGYDSSLF
jgi:hypothetical protein